MDSIINQLCQLQEMILVRDEHRATGNGEHLDRLNAAIEEIAETLPSDVRNLYTRLTHRNHTFMSPIHKGSCAVCGMQLPISQLQLVRQEKLLQNCPTCTRFLFETQNSPAWVGEKPSRNEPIKNGISRFSAPCLMVSDMVATSAVDAIELLAAKMESEHFISHANLLITAALERESVLSTAVGNGIAFPHVRGVEGGGLTLACGVSKAPFKYDSEGSLVNIVFLITIPTAVSAFYLKVIAGLTESFIKESNRDALLATDTPEALWKALCKATRYSIK